jgi:Zinc finger, ZZ type/Ring finger domain
MARIQQSMQKAAVRSSLRPSWDDAASPSTNRKSLEEDDTCPICFDTMTKDDSLVYCVHGCGKNMHSCCMRVWVDHRRKEDAAITCPMCRIEWDKKELMNLLQASQRKSHAHIERKPGHRVSCDHCKRSPIEGTRYKCLSCQEYNLCNSCFLTLQIHSHHNFKSLANTNPGT